MAPSGSVDHTSDWSLGRPEKAALLQDIKMHRHLSVDLSANVPELVSDDELGINLKTA